MFRIMFGAAVLAAIGGVASVDRPGEARAREQMVAEIRNLAATARIGGHGQLGKPVLDALRSVPRHKFVPPSLRSEAYGNHPLEIGHGQTISQPYVVALMTDLLRPAGSHVVLEVGTGSGYQAAVLATLVSHVYSIEIVPPLARQAAGRLRDLGYRNVTVRAGDGYAGWPERAPFDAIIVTAGAPHIPPPLVDQLKRGGRMVIPVGPAHGTQRLILLEKNAQGQVRKRSLGDVAFVPLTGAGRRQ